MPFPLFGIPEVVAGRVVRSVFKLPMLVFGSLESVGASFEGVSTIDVIAVVDVMAATLTSERVAEVPISGVAAAGNAATEAGAGSNGLDSGTELNISSLPL